MAHFELGCEQQLLALADVILAGSYRPAPHRLLEIRDPKPRLIAVATVADRVVHRSVYDALHPLFDRSLIADTYACLPGRGSHRAVLRFLEFQRRYRHVLHLDVAGYFPSVDHGILLGLLSPRLRDPRVVRLLEQILEAGWRLYRRPAVAEFYPLQEAADRHRPRGLPIGNLTSQWWGNLYLSGIDHFAKRELEARAYLRYMDDLVFFADEPTTLRRWRSEIREWLWRHRRLHLNVRHGHVRPTSLPQTYLGYRVSREGLDLGGKAVRRFRKKLATLAAEGDPERLRRSLAAWRGAVGLFGAGMEIGSAAKGDES